MGLLTSRRKQAQSTRQKTEDIFENIDDLLDEVDLEPLDIEEDTQPKKPSPKSQDEIVGGVQDRLTNLVPLTTETVTDTGYQPPAKRRIPQKIAKLRRQIRSKLLADPTEADDWDRHDEKHQKLIIGRIDTILDKLNMTLDDDEYAILVETLLDDLMGFGAIEPLIRDRRYSEIMVNGPDVVFAEFKGKLGETEIVFDDEEHIRYTAQRIGASAYAHAGS